MPHKHKRKRGEEEDKSHFDLPPAARATPLSVQKSQTKIEVLDNNVDERDGKANKRRKPNASAKEKKRTKVVDDTPKQFARLMAWSQEGKALRKGLDDGKLGRKERKRKTKTGGVGKKVNRKTADDDDDEKGKGAITVKEGAGSPGDGGASTTKAKTTKRGSTTPTAPKSIMQPRPSENEQATAGSSEMLKIQPGERLADFALRVDQTLPLSGVPKHSTKETLKVPGLSHKQNLTKHNKKLLRMQSQWREDEKRRKEKGEEREDELEDQKEEDSLLWSSVHDQQGFKKGKKVKRGGVDEGDIWKVLERKKGEAEGKPLTARDMVKEPPKLGKLRSIFKEPGKRQVVGVV